MNFIVNFNSLTVIKVHSGNGTLLPVAHNQLPFITKPISFIPFRSPPKSFVLIKGGSNTSSTFSASSKTHEPLPSAGDERFRPYELSFPFLKTTFIATAVAAAALFFSRTHFISCKPAIASPAISTIKSTSDDTDTHSDEEKEKSLEKHLLSDPNDVEALQSLMEICIRNGKTEDAFRIVKKLIQLEPEEVEWPLVKAHIHAHAGELELARNGFLEIISKHPLKVEAYHGLVVAVSDDDVSKEVMEEIHKRIEEAMKLCWKEKKNNILRDFMLLQAQIFVMEGRYTDAVLMYKHLAKDDPSDFRPYLCQGIMYTVLRKKKEADKYFEKFRELVPKEHPYANYFEDNMIATKALAQEMENAKA